MIFYIKQDSEIRNVSTLFGGRVQDAFFFKTKNKNFFLTFFFLQVFLECSGPLDNDRTIPEWLKNNFKKIEKMCFFFNHCHIKMV